MRVASTSLSVPGVSAVKPAAQAPAREVEAPKDGFTSGKVWAGIAGGTAAGLGLGYLGMNLGADLGMKAALGTFGPSPAGQVLSVFVPGIHYMLFGAAVGGALGLAGGAAAGGYLASSLVGGPRA